MLCLTISKTIMSETQKILTNIVYTIGSVWHLLIVLKPIPTTE